MTRPNITCVGKIYQYEPEHLHDEEIQDIFKTELLKDENVTEVAGVYANGAYLIYCTDEVTDVYIHNLIVGTEFAIEQKK